MEQALKGRRIIVTGAATGIGQATARSLAEQGAALALWDIDADAVATAALQLAQLGSNCIGIGADVSSEVAVEQALAQTIDALGGIDGAFNNAGIGAPTVALDEIAESDFDRMLAVNLKGVWLCMKHQIRHMKTNGGGAIVNNASVAGLVGFQGQSAYAASKHGVVGLSKSAAVECAQANIRINAICPGAVRTPILQHLEAAGVTDAMLSSMSPQNRIAEPKEIAEAVIWLLSGKSSFVTGAAIPVDGGWTTQ